MPVKKYSYKNDRLKKLSENFAVGEFVSKDIGYNSDADTILIDDSLVELLQLIRDDVCEPLTITSGYRTESHNKAVGGASASLHTKGQAADIKSKVYPSFVIAYSAYRQGAKGIECRFYNSASDYVHIDTRTKQWHALCNQNKTGYTTVDNLFGTLQKGQCSEKVKFLQGILIWYGFPIDKSGDFDEITESCVKAVQRLCGLDIDGIVGRKTWQALCITPTLD